MPATRTRPTALDRAEHGAPPLKLSATEKVVLGEALRRGEDLAEELESKLVAYGRWLLEAVFADDARAAIDAHGKNPVWLELVRRAGGTTLPISRRMLYVALQIAARDRRITDGAWRGLDSGRKELLLPLEDDARLREAAQHVSKFKLSQTLTREYVTQLLAGEGRSRQIRLTGPQLAARVKKLRESLGTAGVLRRVKELAHDLPAAERRAIAQEVAALRAVLADLGRTIRGR